MLENFFKSLEIFLFWFQFHNRLELPDKNQKTEKMALFLQVFYNTLLKRKQLRQPLKSQVEKVKKQGFWKLEVSHLSEFSFFMSKGQN